MKQIYLIRTTEYGGDTITDKSGFACALADALCALVSAECLLFAFLRILDDEFPLWKPGDGGMLWIQGFLVLTVLLFGVLVPAAGRFRTRLCAGLEMGYLIAFAWFAAGHMKRLQGGLAAMFGDYLIAWNAYYKTNYYVAEVDAGSIGMAFCYVVILLLALILLLRYVANLRWPMLLLPLLALSLGLLVNVLPGVTGLSLLFAGGVLSHIGGGGFVRLRFVPAKKRDVADSVRGRIGLLRAGIFLVFLSLALTGLLFGRRAMQIPEKAPKYLAFQQELESRIQSLGRSVRADTKEYVDNATPEYRDALILEITASGRPDTNLYLPQFYSGNYENGRWERQTRNYESAAAAAGTDGDYIGTFLWQTMYEWSAGETALLRYGISYKEKTELALLPYFSNAAELADVSIEAEGLVKKKRSVEELAFYGAAGNTDLVQALRFLKKYSEDTYPDWYRLYVQENYVKKSGIPAVEEEAERIVQLPRYGAELKQAASMDANMFRMSAASAVRNRLAVLCDYNLYLDDIPAGTDTVEYFLQTGHEGYCMHFASAGTLILQEMGVPARYASGYIVKRYAFEQQDSGEYSAPVYDRNGHAWAEVYLDGIGWVPFDMTPGYATTENSLPTDEEQLEALRKKHNQKETEAQGNTETESETESGADTETESEADTSRETESQDIAQSSEEEETSASPQAGAPGGRRVLPVGILLFFMTVVCIGGIVILAVRRYKDVLQQELRRKQNRRAVKRMNRRMYVRMQKGLPRGMTDAEFERKLVQTYPGIPEEDWRQYMQIVKKAAFSMEKICEEEVALCLRLYRARRHS